MSGEDILIVWCKKEQDFLCSEIERLESGGLRTFSLAGPTPTETTSSTVVKLKAKLAELDAFLTKIGELP
jgi:hypothetical protein